MASEADIKPFYERTTPCAQDESAHYAWGSDVTLAEGFNVAALLYTQTGHKPSRGVGNMWWG